MLPSRESPYGNSRYNMEPQLVESHNFTEEILFRVLELQIIREIIRFPLNLTNACRPWAGACWGCHLVVFLAQSHYTICLALSYSCLRFLVSFPPHQERRRRVDGD